MPAATEVIVISAGQSGLDFPGDPGRYPHRDEVVAYLRRYAAALGADIRTGSSPQRPRTTRPRTSRNVALALTREPEMSLD